MKDKIETFIGFSVKSRKIIFGINSIEIYKKKIYCLFICKTASENTEKNIIKLAEKLNVPLIKTVDKTLEEITFKDNCKAVALTDKQLSKAILDNLNDGFMPVKNMSGV